MNFNIPHIDLPRIVVIGCGFAGLKFVNKVNSKHYQIVLLDKNNYHTFQPLMYQVASSSLEPDSIVYPIRKIFNGKKNFHFRIAEVDSVNIELKEITSDIGVLRYDILIIATGATINFFGNKDIQQYAYTMKSLVESLDLRSVILENFEKALSISTIEEREAYMNFIIVGGGATGVELAGALAELKKSILPKDYPDLDLRQMQIHIIEASDRMLPNMSSSASKYSHKFLHQLGVRIWLNTFVNSYDGKVVKTSSTDFESKTLIWSAGVKGAPINNLQQKLTKDSRIQTNSFNQVIGHENIFAIGDVAAIETEMDSRGHAMLASVAGQQGRHLAINLNNAIKNKEMLPFKYSDKGTMATIGKNKAVVDLPFYNFSGIIAWFVWMFLHLMLLVDFRNRIVIFMNWSLSYLRNDKGLRLIIRHYNENIPKT